MSEKISMMDTYPELKPIINQLTNAIDKICIADQINIISQLIREFEEHKYELEDVLVAYNETDINHI